MLKIHRWVAWDWSVTRKLNTFQREKRGYLRKWPFWSIIVHFDFSCICLELVFHTFHAWQKFFKNSLQKISLFHWWGIWDVWRISSEDWQISFFLHCYLFSDDLTYSLMFLSIHALKVVEIPIQNSESIPHCSSCSPNNFINKVTGVNFEKISCFWWTRIPGFRQLNDF